MLGVIECCIIVDGKHKAAQREAVSRDGVEELSQSPLRMPLRNCGISIGSVGEDGRTAGGTDVVRLLSAPPLWDSGTRGGVARHCGEIGRGCWCIWVAFGCPLDPQPSA